MCMRKNYSLILAVLAVLTAFTALFLLKNSPKTASNYPASHHTRSSVAHLSPENGILFRVARVIDGDTIDVQIGNQTERIRFIGIDTPETVDERKPIQCYGPEASARMKELLTGKSVMLETKPDEDTDDYGRFLRYVMLDGKDIGAEMLEEGYAKSLCAAFPHPKCAEYDALEQTARNSKRGRWGVCGK